jgi:hypothetical protein
MDSTNLISRRLSPDACVAAGTQLAAEAKALVVEGTDLHPDIASQIDAVAEWTSKLQAFSGSSMRMWDVDRGADRALAAFDDVLEAIERTFADAVTLPVAPEEQQRVALATEVRRAIFPGGTGFLNLPFFKEWARLVDIKKALGENQAALASLGLAFEAGRVARWIDLYGACLGLTEAGSDKVDQFAVALDGWLAAWGELAVAVLYHHKGGDEKSVMVRTKLLGPYERAAEQERAEVRKRRAKNAKKKKTG